MSDSLPYEVLTAVSEKLKANLEDRKSRKELVSYSIEPIYDDYKIEVRIIVFEGIPELIFTLDLLDGNEGKKF